MVTQHTTTRQPTRTVSLEPAANPELPAASNSQEYGNVCKQDGLWVTQLHIQNEFVKTIVDNLPTDKSLERFYKRIVERYDNTVNDEDGPTSTLASFRYDPESKLLFFREPQSDTERLCLPLACHQETLQMAHDNRSHVGIHRTYNYLRPQIFIHRLKRLVETYVNNCPICKLAKPSRQPPKGLMQPVLSPSRPLSVLCLDLITGLPLSTQGNDAVFTITDKFTKFVKTLTGREDWTAEDWAQAYYKHIFPGWGL